MHLHGAEWRGSHARPQCSNVPHQSQQSFWGGAQDADKQVRGLERLALAAAGGHDLHDPAAADSGLGDVLRRAYRTQSPGDVAAVADLVICCHEKDPALSLELAADLGVQCLLVGLDRQEEVSPCASICRKRLFSVQRIRLDQHAVEIQLAEQLPQHCPLLVVSRGVASLADRHTQSSRVEHHLGNEYRAAAGRGLDRAPEGLAIAHQLLEIAGSTRDLIDHPVTDGSAQCRDIHLQDERAERGDLGRSPQLKAKCLDKQAVVTDSKKLQIPQTLVATEDAQHRHQQQRLPSREPHTTPHPHIRDRREIADQVEICCSSGGFGTKQGQGR